MIERILVVVLFGASIMFMVLALISLLRESLSANVRGEELRRAHCRQFWTDDLEDRHSIHESRPGMSVAGSDSTSGHQRDGYVIARKRRIRQRLSAAKASNLEDRPSIAGWAAYVAKALAFLLLCGVSAFK